ncbi:MAG: hypothetical protein RBS13_01460 [Bacteroidales bacterium]|jgi:hypothetical protein|nr:hypothetical protein [Bacteroidales bacterium]
MEIKKYILIIFTSLSIFGCIDKKNIKEKFDHLYQIYTINDSTLLYIKIYDDWGEKNELGLIKNNKIFLATFMVDPIPEIEKVSNDTIFLVYYRWKKDHSIDTMYYENPIDIDRYKKVGDYKIIYHQKCFLYGEGMSPYPQKIDSIFYNRYSSKVSLFYKNCILKELPLSELFFEKNMFCYFQIFNNERRWYYFIPVNQKITKKYFNDIYKGNVRQ